MFTNLPAAVEEHQVGLELLSRRKLRKLQP
jgi:hypothetical protein